MQPMNLTQSNQRMTGLGFFEGDIDGKEIKSGSIFIESNLDESKGNSKGMRTVEHKVDMDVVKALMHNPMPLMVDLEFEQRVTRGASTFRLINVKSLRAPETLSPPAPGNSRCHSPLRAPYLRHRGALRDPRSPAGSSSP